MTTPGTVCRWLEVVDDGVCKGGPLMVHFCGGIVASDVLPLIVFPARDEFLTML